MKLKVFVISCILMIIGSLLIKNGAGSFAGLFYLFAGGYAGFADGKKQGYRDALAGKTKLK